MEIFQGRRAASGQWVAYGAIAELNAVASTGETVEVVTASGGVTRCRINFVGRAFRNPHGGELIAYGYMGAVDQEDAA